MELNPDNSAEENYEYDSSEVQDYSALSSFTNVNCADDKWEDGEPYTLEEGTVLFPLVKMTKPQAGTLPSWIYISYSVYTSGVQTHTGTGLASCEPLYDINTFYVT